MKIVGKIIRKIYKNKILLQGGENKLGQSLKMVAWLEMSKAWVCEKALSVTGDVWQLKWTVLDEPTQLNSQAIPPFFQPQNMYELVILRLTYWEL